MAFRQRLLALVASITNHGAQDVESCTADKHEEGFCSVISPECTLILANSTIPNAGLGIFTTTPLPPDTPVGYGDVVIPLWDLDFHMGTTFYKNPFDDYVWDGRHLGMQADAVYEVTSDNLELEEATMDIGAFAVGLDAAVNCHLALDNVERRGVPSCEANVGGHRSRSHMSGSMTPYHNASTYTTHEIPAGGELFKHYGDHWFTSRPWMFGEDLPLQDDYISAERMVHQLQILVKGLSKNQRQDFFETVLGKLPLRPQVLGAIPRDYISFKKVLKEGIRSLYQPAATRSLSELRTQGRCVDSIQPKSSTLPNAGRGAFATRFLPKDSTITGSPLLHLGSHRLADMYNWHLDEEGGRVRDTTHVARQQLFINYCMGHADSSILLCPYSSGVLYMNHNQSLANVRLQWAPNGTLSHDGAALELDPHELEMQGSQPRLAIDYIALKDIEAGEELLLDYGNEFEEALQEHQRQWIPHEESYLSAIEWNAMHETNSVLRTQHEQLANPYPSNLSIRCHPIVAYGFWNIEQNITETTNLWPLNEPGMPCDILSRTDHWNQHYTYRVLVHGVTQDFEKTRVERNMITFVDVPYSTDAHLSNSFRHHVGIPDELMPDAWRNDVAVKID